MEDRDILVVDFTATRVRSVSKSLQSEGRLSDIRLLFAALAAQSLNADFVCNLIWHSPVEGVELPIRLPFGLPLATTSEMDAVTGIRVSSTDGSVWVILDLTHGDKDDWFHVSCGFTHELALGEYMLEEVIQRGTSLVEQLIVIKSKGE